MTLLLIFFILIINYYIFILFELPKKFLFVVYFIIGIYLAFIFLNDFNAKSLGFKEGIFYGKVDKKNKYYDSYNYYKDVIKLKTNIKTKGIINYILLKYKKDGYYGPYNIFVVLLTLISFIVGSNVIHLLIVKLIFTIFSIYFFVKISNLYLSEKNTIICMLLFYLFPENIYVNSLLMRDNIILFLVLFSYYLAFFKINLLKFFFIPLITISFVLRPYAIVLWLPILYFNLKDLKRNNKNLINLSIFLIILLFIPFIWQNINQLAIADNSWAGSYIYRTKGILLFLFSLYYFLWSHNISYINYSFNVIPDILTFSSTLLIHIFLFCIPWFYYIVYKKNYFEKFKHLNLFLLSSFAYIFLYTSIFGGVIPRIYLPYLWANVIIFIFFIQIQYKYIKIYFVFSLLIFYLISYIKLCKNIFQYLLI